MSKIGVSLKINVSMIEKARLFAGQKGQYLDATVFIDLDQLDQYGNSGMITQDVSKEEKAQNVKGAILGNCKVFWSAHQSAHYTTFEQQQQQAPRQQAPQQQAPRQQAPQQAPRDAQGFTAAQGGFQQQAPQQAPAMNNDFNDDVPFAPVGLPYNNFLIHVI